MEIERIDGLKAYHLVEDAIPLEQLLKEVQDSQSNRGKSNE